MITSYSEEETKDFAQEFVSNLCVGDVVLLHGDLGMGKSVFARACIRSLVGEDVLEVPSPTFTLVQMYDADLAPLWHFDLYRLSDPSEIYEIGWDDALDGGILFVEWAERLGGLLPKKRIEVTLSQPSGDGNVRNIEVVKYGYS